MDKNTKITLAELIKRKEQVLEAKKNVKRARVYVKSLGESGKAALTLRCLGTDPVRIGFEVICPKDSEG